MREAEVFVKGVPAGILREIDQGRGYEFRYHDHYQGTEVSRTMPLDHSIYQYDRFPPFFEGLLPEGIQLEGLLKLGKIDKKDLFSQLLAIGEDVVGAVTIKEIIT